ncbi:MAG: nicotinate-nucleotide adenylyltransferase [Deltaproteobacteria bacterium]
MKEQRERIGILGGTFDPIHLGHLRAAEELCEILRLDVVYFTPALIPPHKDSSDITPPQDRLLMLEAAILGNPRFKISDVELRRKGASYTIDTLSYFREAMPQARVTFIMGSDLLSQIETWKDYTELFEIANIAVIARPGLPREDFASMLPLAIRRDFRYYKERAGEVIYLHKGGMTLSFVAIEGIELSSTRIREIAGAGRSIKYLVPEPVECYIVSKKLYIIKEPSQSE